MCCIPNPVFFVPYFSWGRPKIWLNERPRPPGNPRPNLCTPVAKPNKREQARELFMEHIPMQKIALYLDVHPSTLSEWAKDSNWYDERQKLRARTKSIETMLLELGEMQIAHTLNEARQQVLAGEFKGIDKETGLTIQRILANFRERGISGKQAINLLDELQRYTERLDFDAGQVIGKWAIEFIRQKDFS